MKRLSKSAFLFNAVLFFVIAFTAVSIAQGPPNQGGNPPPAPTSSVTSTSPFGAHGGILEPPGGGVLDGVYIPEHLTYRKPLPYVYEREADIMWSKRVWRVIDLREKMNHPLYYPTDDLAKRPSLFKVLQDGIYSGKINTVFTFDPFTMEFGPALTLPEIVKTMTEQLALKDSIGNPLMDSVGNQIMKPDTLRADRISQYYVKEDWFFEKQRSVMDVRIISIAPVVEVNDPVNGKYTYHPLFWLYYPAIRDYLSRFYCYNPYNDAEWRTYDEIFHKRMFSSYTMMESNVYNRTISAYLPGQGMDQMLESERIKDDIFKFEHDMWHF